MTQVGPAFDSDGLATRYDRVSAESLLAFGRRLIDALELSTGERVIDVGCGTGLLTEHVADLVGPSGAVVGIDPLPHRVDIAARRAAANVTFRVGTAYDLSAFDAASFDAAYLHFVFHWLDDQPAALRQLHRVLVTGGRLGLTASARECENTFRTARRIVLNRPEYAQYRTSEAGDPHRVAANELARLLDHAGFDLVTLQRRTVESQWTDAKQMIAGYETVWFGSLFGDLPPEVQSRARADLVAELERARTPAGIPVRSARTLAVAVKRGG